MKPSPRTKSAIDALGEIARAGPTPVSLAVVARGLGLSVSYLEQIFSVLRAAGVVESVRGPGGGYRLPGSPETVNLATVASLFADDSNDQTQGPYAAFWESYNQDMSSLLKRRTLADVVAVRSSVPSVKAATAELR